MKILPKSAYKSPNPTPKAEWRHVQFDVAGTRLLRQRLLEIGQSMVDSGLLEQADDIFFLAPEEVQEASIRFTEVSQPMHISPSSSTQSLQSYW